MPFLPRSQNDEEFVEKMIRQGATADEAEALLDDHYAEMMTDTEVVEEYDEETE